jgi:catechol 2,3-dioxygenase-like lactoylglutathione lyase family enzyme
VIRGLDHATLKVRDAAQASAFYRDVLGARVQPLAYGRVRFWIGDAAIHVHAPDSTPFPTPRMVATAGSGDLCFEWAGSAQQAVDHLARHGVAVLTGPVDRETRRGAGRSVYFHDPDGNLLELVSYQRDDD